MKYTIKQRIETFQKLERKLKKEFGEKDFDEKPLKKRQKLWSLFCDLKEHIKFLKSQL